MIDNPETTVGSLWDDPEESSLPTTPDWFAEDAYLKAHPDVAAAVARNELRTGYDHYITIGAREHRVLRSPGAEPRGRLLRTGPVPTPDSAKPESGRLCVEAMLVSDAGGIMVVGWIDDTMVPLDYLLVRAVGWQYSFDTHSIVRFRRTDVEASFGSSRTHAFGFIAFAFLGTSCDVPEGKGAVTVGTKGGGHSTVLLAARQVDDVEMRKVVLSYIAESEFFGNRQIAAMHNLDGPIGDHIISHNLCITRKIVEEAYVERFGTPTRPIRGSIVVCLYGKIEYLFLQNALFADCPGFEDYELVYVSNSPEMAEPLLREAMSANRIYGILQTVVILPGNAGFGAANNVAVNYARSNRILIVNPDVFPRDLNWALKHTEVIDNLPACQSKLFGVPLYYDDGTLMHGGMYFEFDKGVSIEVGRVVERRMLRVEHYGKGAPIWASEFTRSRPIQAVTGAFISTDRLWYERLGGFTEKYVFGHYEDADLCLKSIVAGSVPWIHDIRLWHLEGKGSLRLQAHNGGTLVNRWLFTRTWSETISDGLEGPKPASSKMLPTTTSVSDRDVNLPVLAPVRRPVVTAPSKTAGRVRSKKVNRETVSIIGRPTDRPLRKNAE
jgi:hypothetical protein